MLALRIKKAVRKGATLVVADPRKIWLTKLARRHLQLRPGTDVWLLNAMMHTILEEGLQDEAYIRESILFPPKKVVEGYEPIMPTFQGQVTEDEILLLIAYIRSLERGDLPKQNNDTPAPVGAPTELPKGEGKK